MTAAYILDIRTLGRETWEAAERLLPTERLKKAATIRDKNGQKQSLGAGLLLQHALRRVGIDPDLMTYDEAGKPILPENKAFISLSHSGNWAACVLSEYPAGIDVQDMTEGTPSLLTKYFHPDEQEFVWLGGQDSFYQVWCRKECYIKAFGWRELPKINTIIAPDTYSYFDFQPEKTVMGCVLSRTQPSVWMVKEADIFREA